MYTRLMTGFKKLFTTTYNLGRAMRPKPLPDVEVRLSSEFNKLKQSEEKISKATLQAAFLPNKSNDVQNGLVAQGR